jgi:hypothetical protein
MADQDGEAIGRKVRPRSRAPLEPGRERRTGAGFPGPAGARDRNAPAVEHGALPIAYASTVAASTSANPSRAAPSYWRLHQTVGNRTVQRVIALARSDAGEGDLSSVVAHGTSGGGHALDMSTRSFMESRFGRDFGDVKVHTGMAAEESARSIGAVAYTVGGDIVFGAGHYAPHTTEGRWLLSHELTHTIQQGGHARSGVGHDAAPSVHTGSHGLVQMVGECAGKSKSACWGSCTHANGNPGTCRWSGTIANGCVCYENPRLSPLKQVLYDLIIAALIAAGIVITVVAVAAIVACLSGPCEVAALIAALGYAGAMIVLGIIRSRGSGAGSEAPPTAAAEGEEVGEEAMA